MTQKHHQEEISGPNDTIEAAPLAKDCPRLKRTRIQSRKAQENQVQSQSFEVLSLQSITYTIPTLSNEYFLFIRDNVSQSKRQRSLLRQNSS